MHSDERQKLIALLTAVLLAPRFDPISSHQDDLRHDPRVEAALRTARTICDAVEDLESRPEAVVFDPPRDVETERKVVGMPFPGDTRARRSGDE
jgi:hypothetical protein